MVYDLPPSQDAATHQIWDSYLKEYRRYAQDSMQILETRSEDMVTMTEGWYTTLSHLKTGCGIPSSNDMRYAPDTIILRSGSEVTVSRKW